MTILPKPFNHDCLTFQYVQVLIAYTPQTGANDVNRRHVWQPQYRQYVQYSTYLLSSLSLSGDRDLDLDLESSLRLEPLSLSLRSLLSLVKGELGVKE
jgi:hypothetical protein